MLPPSPSIGMTCRGGSTISRLSLPRTQRGTITFSVWTLSRPSVFMASTAHAMARFRLSDPDSRLP
jgi:hypothetical protein